MHHCPTCHAPLSRMVLKGGGILRGGRVKCALRCRSCGCQHQVCGWTDREKEIVRSVIRNTRAYVIMGQRGNS